MEAKIRNLFQRKSNVAQPYDTTLASQPPVRSLYPAPGNGSDAETLRHDSTRRRTVDSGVEEAEEEVVEMAVAVAVAFWGGSRTLSSRISDAYDLMIFWLW